MSTSNRARKPRNRNQRKKVHQLDVRMRSKKETQQRTVELMKLMLRVGCIAGAIVATFFSSRWVYRKAFYENADFALTDLRVETDGELSYQRIVSVAEVREGVNLVGIDIEGVRERLGQVPKVKGVEVLRKLPNELTIKVEERAPVAWLSCPALGIRSRTSQRGFLLDEEGVVVPCESLLKKYLNLPVIRARTLPRVKAGSPIEVEEVKVALELIERSGEMFFADQLEILEVDIRSEYAMMAYYNNDAEVTFGMEDIEEQLNDLKLILAHTTAKNRHVATLNLMVRKNIPITYFNSSGDQIEIPTGPMDPVTRPGTGGRPGNEEAEKRLNAIRAILGRG